METFSTVYSKVGGPACIAGRKSRVEACPEGVRILRQTEGVTGSHQNWRRGETREGAALKETTKHSGKGNSKGPLSEQRGPAAPKTQTSNSNPGVAVGPMQGGEHRSAMARQTPPSSRANNHQARGRPACAARQPPRVPKPKQAVKTAQKQSGPKAQTVVVAPVFATLWANAQHIRSLHAKRAWRGMCVRATLTTRLSARRLLWERACGRV